MFTRLSNFPRGRGRQNQRRSFCEDVQWRYDRMGQLLKNQGAYWQMRTPLLKQHGLNKVAVISQEKLAGVFDSFYDAQEMKIQLKDTAAAIIEIGGEFKKYAQLSDASLSPQIMLFPTERPEKLFGEEIEAKKFQPTFQFVGLTKRPWVTLGVSTKPNSPKVRPVMFFVDTGATKSFMEDKTLEALEAPEAVPLLYIDGIPRDIFRSSYSEPSEKALVGNINLLGTDVLWSSDLRIRFLELLSVILKSEKNTSTHLRQF